MAKTTHTTDTSRRAILGGAGILAACTVAPIAAAPIRPTTSPALEAAFADWKHCLAVINEEGRDADDDDDDPFWQRIDAAEVAILNAPEATPRVAAMRLWVALQHLLTGKDHDQAIIRGDLSRLLADAPTLDWNERHIINALAAVEGRSGAPYKKLNA